MKTKNPEKKLEYNRAYSTKYQTRAGYKEMKKEYDKVYKSLPHIKEKDWENWIKRAYSISVDDYKKLYEDQNGKCAICGNKSNLGRKEKLCVDHNHKTNKVRGLLCDLCNKGIGSLKDDIKNVKAALTYLEKYDK